jgi:hypothetical protein
MPAVAFVASRASHVGRVRGDRKHQKGFPGPGYCRLGHETLDNSLRRAVAIEAKAYKGLYNHVREEVIIG